MNLSIRYLINSYKAVAFRNKTCDPTLNHRYGKHLYTKAALVLRAGIYWPDCEPAISEQIKQKVNFILKSLLRTHTYCLVHVILFNIPHDKTQKDEFRKKSYK